MGQAAQAMGWDSGAGDLWCPVHASEPRRGSVPAGRHWMKRQSGREAPGASSESQRRGRPAAGSGGDPGCDGASTVTSVAPLLICAVSCWVAAL